MTILNKQLNTSWKTLILLTIAILGVGLSNNASANIFDWVSNNEEAVTDNKSFDFLTFFLNTNDTLGTGQQENNANLSVMQNSSLISISSPVTPGAASIAKTNPIKLREMLVAASAYSSTPDQTDDSPFITAWNTHVRDGIIATNFLPFGTKIKIPDLYGDKIFTVEDRMNRRYWYKVDLWFPDRQSALEFGIKNIKIQILES